MERLMRAAVTFAIMMPLNATAFPSDGPLAMRQEALRAHFEPTFDEELHFSKLKLLNFKKGDSFETLSGEIMVNPPKGTCFTIQLNPEFPDRTICKKAPLKFNFRDLDPVGKLSAQVSVNGDFGTTVTWQTPYRLALTIGWAQEAESVPERWLITGCKPYHDEFGRHVKVELLGHRPWIIHFPAKDNLLPQPPPEPNLKIVQGTEFEGIMEMAERRRMQNEAKEKEQQGESAGVVIKSRQDGPKDRLDWHIPVRDTFEMPADNFQPRGRVPAGGKGLCRYRYKGSDADPDVGRIECHDADNFQFMYAPLACLKGV